MQRYEDRLARAIGMIVNLVDPDVIVVGGGVSNVDRIFVNVPKLLPRYVYSQNPDVRVVRAGERQDMSAGSEHELVIGPEGPCVAGVVERGLTFSGPVLGLLGRWFSI